MAALKVLEQEESDGPCKLSLSDLLVVLPLHPITREYDRLHTVTNTTREKIMHVRIH